MLKIPPLIVRHLGIIEYGESFQLMKTFTNQRSNLTSDEIWIVQHQPVFTQGQAGKDEYILDRGNIPVIKTDRGGHITYHGPGQITAYLMIDLRRVSIGVRDLVSIIEKALIATLDHWDIKATPRSDAPGVYTMNGEKIASLGLRIKKGCSYHGLNFNVSMDMSPWQQINPCGLGVQMTQVADLLEISPSFESVTEELLSHLTKGLRYNDYENTTDKPLSATMPESQHYYRD
jgi:lipoyl(octanoyl) transferase